MTLNLAPENLLAETPVRCVNCRRDAFASSEERFRDRWTCYACGRVQKVSDSRLAQGAYATVEEAVREWTRIRRKSDRAASTSVWLAPGGGYFVAGARLSPHVPGWSDLRGSKRVYRFRRARRGAPLEVLDERVPGAVWTVLDETERS